MGCRSPLGAVWESSEARVAASCRANENVRGGILNDPNSVPTCFIRVAILPPKSIRRLSTVRLARLKTLPEMGVIFQGPGYYIITRDQEYAGQWQPGHTKEDYHDYLRIGNH